MPAIKIRKWRPSVMRDDYDAWYENEKQRILRKYYSRKAAGLCTRCAGKMPEGDTRTLCRECMRKNLEARKRRFQREREEEANGEKSLCKV